MSSGIKFYTSRAYPLAWVIQVRGVCYLVPHEVGGWTKRREWVGDVKALTPMSGTIAISKIKSLLQKGVIDDPMGEVGFFGI